MSDNDAGFRDKHQELEHLVQELKETKDLMKDISSKMTQIERHVKRAFLPVQANKRDLKGKADGRTARIVEKPTINAEQALAIFDELKSLSLSERGNEALKRLEKMIVPDLRMIAHEVGLAFASKPSKKLLISRIRGRINESMLLSKNVNVTQPRSALLGNNEEKPDLDEVDSQRMLGGKS
jgi:superfamily I DNA/RNA helicase